VAAVVLVQCIRGKRNEILQRKKFELAQRAEHPLQKLHEGDRGGGREKGKKGCAMKSGYGGSNGGAVPRISGVQGRAIGEGRPVYFQGRNWGFCKKKKFPRLSREGRGGGETGKGAGGRGYAF